MNLPPMSLDEQLHDLADTYRSAAQPPPELLDAILERVEHRPNRWWRAAAPALVAAAVIVAVAVAGGLLADEDTPVATGTMSRAEWIEAAEPVCAAMVAASAGVEPRFLTAEAYTVAGEAFRLAAVEGGALAVLPQPEDDPGLPLRLAERLTQAIEHADQTLLMARDGYLTVAAREFDQTEGHVDGVIAELTAYGVPCTTSAEGD